MANPKSQQFKLTKAHITADRFGGFENKFFDVKNQVAEIKNISPDDAAMKTTENFFNLFTRAKRDI